MLNEVVKGLAGEGVNLIVLEKEVVPIDHGRAGACETSGVVETVEALLRRGGLEDGRVSRVELASRVGRCEVGIAGEVALFENVVPEGKAVLDAEPVSPIVAGSTELRGSGKWFEDSLVGLHSEIKAAEIEGLV